MDSDEFEIFLKELDGSIKTFAASHSCKSNSAPPVAGMRFLYWLSDGLCRHLGIMSAVDQERAKLRISISASKAVKKPTGVVRFEKSMSREYTRVGKEKGSHVFFYTAFDV